MDKETKRRNKIRQSKKNESLNYTDKFYIMQ